MEYWDGRTDENQSVNRFGRSNISKSIVKIPFYYRRPNETQHTSTVDSYGIKNHKIPIKHQNY